MSLNMNIMNIIIINMNIKLNIIQLTTTPLSLLIEEMIDSMTVGRKGVISSFSTVATAANSPYADLRRSGSSLLLIKRIPSSIVSFAKGIKFSPPIVLANIPKVSIIKVNSYNRLYINGQQYML